MNEKNTLGDFIKKKRIEKNWAVYKLHRESGISTTYINQIETGIRKLPSIPILKKLATALDIPYETLLQKANYLTPTTLKETTPAYTQPPHTIPILPLTPTPPQPPHPQTKNTLSIPHTQHPDIYAVLHNNDYLIIHPTATRKKTDLLLIHTPKTQHTLHPNTKPLPKNASIHGKVLWTLKKHP